MSTTIKPIYLFSDSELLFWRSDEKELFLNSMRRHVRKKSPKAAYIGASNGDDPAYYTLFEAAMEGVGVTDCRMIYSEVEDEDKRFLERADIVLLAGGDPVRGYRIFEKNGVRDIIARRYFEGLLLIGISAGAVQLGWAGYAETGPVKKLIDTFKLVPMVIGAHEEKTDWQRLQEAVKLTETANIHGLGIPKGGGVIFQPDRSLRPVRYPAHEFQRNEDEEGTITLKRGLLFPPDDDEEHDDLAMFEDYEDEETMEDDNDVVHEAEVLEVHNPEIIRSETGEIISDTRITIIEETDDGEDDDDR